MKCLYTLVLAIGLASGACASMSRFDPPDTRLDKKITIQESDIKLDELARLLTKQSGVTVTAGTGSRDWKVREQRVTVSAKDVSIGAILDQLTKLHSFHLSREGKQGEWSYVVWQDKKSRDLEAEMLNAEKEEEAGRATKTRQATLDLAKKAAELTPEEAAKLRDTDPDLAYLAGTKSGRAYTQIFNSLSQTDMDLMLRGMRVSIPFSSLSPTLQQSAIDTTKSGITALMSPKGPDLTPFQVVISPLREDIAGELISMGVGGAIAVMGMPEGGLTGSNYDPILGSGEPMSIFLLSKPDSSFGKVFSQAMFDLENGASKDEIERSLENIFHDQQAMAELTAQDSPTEKTPPTDPELTGEVDLGKLTSASGNPHDTLSANAAAVAAIAEASGYTVMLESFARPASIAGYLKPGKQPFYKILVGIEKSGHTWSVENKNLRIRPSDWAIRRSWAVSESTIAYWKTRLEKEGYFSLDDLATMVYGLTDDQISHTIKYDPEIGYALMFRHDQTDHELSLLRLYASLSSVQRAALGTKMGLRFSDLSDVQWNYVSSIISDRLGGVSIVDGFVTNWRQETDNGQHSGDKKLTDPWRFEIAVIGEDQQMKAFEVNIRHYDKDTMEPIVKQRIEAREKAKSHAAGQDAGTAK